MATMKAARRYALKDIRKEEAVIPMPGDAQVKTDAKSTDICGSGLHEYTRGLSKVIILVDSNH